MSALHHFTYPRRLTVSFNVCEHRPVNHNIFTLSSPAQAKVNLPLVHYRHDTGIPPPHLPPPLGPSGEGRGCRVRRREAGREAGREGWGLWEDSLCSSVYCFHVVQPVTKLGCPGQWLIHTLRSRAWNERAGSAKALGLMIAPWHHTPNTPPYKSWPNGFIFLRWSPRISCTHLSEEGGS